MRQPELGADQGNGHGRIDVADDHCEGRLFRDCHRLVGHHHACSLLGMTAAADPEVVVRFGQAQVTEEGIRHVGVVVLTGVHQPDVEGAVGNQRMP